MARPWLVSSGWIPASTPSGLRCSFTCSSRRSCTVGPSRASNSRCRLHRIIRSVAERFFSIKILEVGLGAFKSSLQILQSKSGPQASHPTEVRPLPQTGRRLSAALSNQARRLPKSSWALDHAVGLAHTEPNAMTDLELRLGSVAKHERLGEVYSLG